MKSLIALAALAALFAFPAIAQQCGPTQSVMVQLATTYGEEITETRTVEKDGQDVVLRFWLNDVTKTWTITATVPGATCLLAAGKDHTNESIDGFLNHISGQAI